MSRRPGTTVPFAPGTFGPPQDDERRLTLIATSTDRQPSRSTSGPTPRVGMERGPGLREGGLEVTDLLAAHHEPGVGPWIGEHGEDRLRRRLRHRAVAGHQFPFSQAQDGGVHVDAGIRHHLGQVRGTVIRRSRARHLKAEPGQANDRAGPIPLSAPVTRTLRAIPPCTSQHLSPTLDASARRDEYVPVERGALVGRPHRLRRRPVARLAYEQLRGGEALRAVAPPAPGEVRHRLAGADPHEAAGLRRPRPADGRRDVLTPVRALRRRGPLCRAAPTNGGSGPLLTPGSGTGSATAHSGRARQIPPTPTSPATTSPSHSRRRSPHPHARRSAVRGRQFGDLCRAEREETPIRHRSLVGGYLVHADSVLLGLAVE